MHLVRHALLLLVLAATALAAPLPFQRKGKVQADPVPALLARLALDGEVHVPELSAVISAEAVRGNTLEGSVVKVHYKNGDLKHTICATACKIEFDGRWCSVWFYGRSGVRACEGFDVHRL
jgi:hypothetical protein